MWLSSGPLLPPPLILGHGQLLTESNKVPPGMPEVDVPAGDKDPSPTVQVPGPVVLLWSPQGPTSLFFHHSFRELPHRKKPILQFLGMQQGPSGGVKWIGVKSQWSASMEGVTLGDLAFTSGERGEPY